MTRPAAARPSRRSTVRFLLAFVPIAVAAAAVGVMASVFLRGRPDGDPSSTPAETIALGRQVYSTTCASCHGAAGEGQAGWRTPREDGTLLPPPHDSTGHTWHHDDALLIRVIREGGKFYEQPGFKSAMPAFGDVLSDAEIDAVLAYIKTFWGPEEREAQARGHH